MLTLSIDRPLFSEFPSLRVGAFIATDLDRAAAYTSRRTSRAPIVALCSAISARHLVRVSGHDLDALPESLVRLRHARPESDWFLPLGARPTDLPLNPQVVVYAAGEIVLAWARARHESRQTCLDFRTRRAMFFSEAVLPEHARVAETALTELRRALTTRGARAGTVAFADVTAPEISLPFTSDEGQS